MFLNNVTSQCREVNLDGAAWIFFLSSIISIVFLPLFWRGPDIDWKTVSKGR